MQLRKVFITLCITTILCVGCASNASTEPMKEAPAGSVRIACVGDSITFGAFVRDRKNNSYPSRLQQLLGDRYTVHNYGVNAHAMLRTSDKPYWNHSYFGESHSFNPDIVLIMLGTNDSKKKNWTSMEEFIDDYRDMIASYQALPSNPKIYLLTPPAAYGNAGPFKLHFKMDLSTIIEIGDAVKQLGRQLGLEVIDTYAVTANHRDYYFLDGIHPDADGANVIAETVYAALMASPATIDKAG